MILAGRRGAGFDTIACRVGCPCFGTIRTVFGLCDATGEPPPGDAFCAFNIGANAPSEINTKKNCFTVFLTDLTHFCSLSFGGNRSLFGGRLLKGEKKVLAICEVVL